MNAIVPVNISAIRVSNVDNTAVVGNFKGRVAAFEKLPFAKRLNSASTGDKIFLPLESQVHPANNLGIGVHLHWELPDYFRKGVQPPDGSDIVFPAVPNRWLVTRFLRLYDKNAGTYGDVRTRTFIIESDYLSPVLLEDADKALRPAVSVPVPYTDANGGKQPFMYMGRVMDYASWSPGTEPAANYLPAYKREDEQNYYLTSVGFVGPGFSSFYPECNSVFGFWDRFLDVPEVFTPITQNLDVQFKVSYQVTGWINETASDPLAGLQAVVKKRYDDLLVKYRKQKVEMDKTPADIFAQVMEQHYGWSVDTEHITATFNSDGTLNTADLPLSTLCSGIIQEVVWKLSDDSSNQCFLSSSPGVSTSAIWTDNSVKVAVGNTTAEAVAAIVKHDLGNAGQDPDLSANYEYLLNAFQLGLLQTLENETNSLFDLDEMMHSTGYERVSGGQLWIVQQERPEDTDVPPNSEREINLPDDLAEQLSLLNQAQKKYDQGRAALDAARKQLFMDWLRYVKMDVETKDPNIDFNKMSAFMLTSSGGAINEVVKLGNEVGFLNYDYDKDTGIIKGISKAPAAAGSYAAAVYDNFGKVARALSGQKGWQLAIAPGAPFYKPSDPVLVMEGDKIVPVRRNGVDPLTNVRLSGGIISDLQVTFNDTHFDIKGSSLTGLPAVSSSQPAAADVQALIREACFLAPMLADMIAASLKAQGGNNNPAAADSAGFVNTLRLAQGGFSPLESSLTGGLFSLIRQENYKPVKNPVQVLSAPMAITFGFTNDASTGWLPNAVAWSAQQLVPNLSQQRVDPFMPVYLIWNVNFNPLKKNNTDGVNYDPTNLTDYFTLDNNAIDYEYKLVNGTPVDFTTGRFVTAYTGAAPLSKKPAIGLSAQIRNYLKHYPADPNKDALNKIADSYTAGNYISQSLDGFNLQQLLRKQIPQITVQNLTAISDPATTTLNRDADTANQDDNWYDFSFNSLSPLYIGALARENFGPLRSGFFQVQSLEIVDVFGQRLQVDTALSDKDQPLEIIPSFTMQCVPGDKVNAGNVYLPPRILESSRLWFKWLSATHNNHVPGINDDFVEMNTHPATSPVTGWVLPNHLDNSLFFYDADGTPIGSFGIEHQTLKYRTRAGNLSNPGDDLPTDLAKVNLHIAAFMQFISGKNYQFLQDLMTSILQSDQYMNAPNFASNAGLGVFIGRPLALTRAQIAVETLGYALPLSQADNNPTDAYPQDILNGRTKYADRQAQSSAALQQVNINVRLGDLVKANDGLVGYLVERKDDNTFYAPTAPEAGSNGVVRPSPGNLSLNLNAPAVVVTMLIDPRAAVNATTGILPVQSLQIPPDQYTQTMQRLAVTFFTHPVMKKQEGFAVPIPAEAGYDWSWIQPIITSAGGTTITTALKPNAVNDNATYGYSPQMLLEGWLQLGKKEE